MGELTLETFAPHLGSEFRVPDGGTEDSVVLHLTAIDPGLRQPDAPRVQPFSLVFTGPPRPHLGQGIHRLEHDELGGLDIFLVPIGYDATGSIRYEAVFN